MKVQSAKHLLCLLALLLVSALAQAQPPAQVAILGVERSICDIFTGGRCIGAQYDAGKVTVTINGTPVSVNYGKGSTNTGLASALATAIPTAVSGVSASAS